MSWVLLPSLLVAFPGMVQAQTTQDWVLTIAKPDDVGMSESVPDQSTLRSLGGGQPSIAEFSDGQTLVVFAHQDDDLLWMMPFWPVTSKFLLAAYPAAPIFEDLTTSFPPQLNYHVRWTPIWGTVDNDIWAEIFTDRCKRAPIVNLATLKSHLRPYLTSSIKRIVTHNNWGEYGHAQHRLVNMAVRQLAVEKGVDVWALGTRMPLGAREQATYLARIPAASTPELTAKFRSWSATLWTWSDQPEAFPMGWRPFVKLVDKGVDLTIKNSAVKQLESSVMIFNDCPASPTLPNSSDTGFSIRDGDKRATLSDTPTHRWKGKP